ncbi:tail length tape measure protein [Mycobacterium phage Indlulamithi]|uniref:Tape measure protein n=1 Tax=Mycobacterium phage Indlulamithi TaxID=2656582 RepID=A0A649VDB4_9CAUD|nr:tail length tape measure protein [Mycobacterium phage Indlulamithi]QGJ90065.1 tape measure protein [Mycobacterium phage Indlulamithi]
MTEPFGGGAGPTNLGTTVGRVRIDYESNSARAVRDAERFQDTLVGVGASAQSSARQVGSAVQQINNFAAQTARVSSRIKNPTEGLGKGVAAEVNKAQDSLRALERQIEKQTGKAVKLKGAVNFTPTDVKIDKGAITQALDLFQRNFNQPLKLSASVQLTATDVQIDKRAIETAIEGLSLDRIVLRTPVHIEPTEVTVNRDRLQSAVNSGGPVNVSGQSAQQQGGGSGAGAGALAGSLARGGLGMAARVAAPLAAAGAVGSVLTAGFSRLEAIDQATTKLQALGKTEQEITAISKTALNTVQDTAFGLDESFSAATNAISSGIQPGQQLNDYMSALASTAALANTSMTDLGDAFSTAAVQGKLTGDVMDMLYSRQVPVLQLLADEYDTTQQHAQEMVSNGEVSFDRFIHAMNQNADAAKIMGNTVQGSFQNLLASVKRIGAGFLAPLFQRDASGASTLSNIIQGLTNRLKAFEGFMTEHKDTIVDVYRVAGKAVLLWADTVMTAIGWVLEGIGKLIEGIGHVPSAFAGIADFFGAHGVADNLRRYSDNMTNWGTATFEAGQKVFTFQGTLDQAYAALEHWSDEAKKGKTSTGELGDSAEKAAPQAISLKDALEALKIQADQAEDAIKGSNEQFEKFIDQVKEKGGTQDLIDTLTKIRQGYENGGRAVDEFAEAIENFGDKTIDADSRAKEFIRTLQNLGQVPNDDALIRYNQTVEDAIGYQSNLVDYLDTTGDALVKNGGQLDLNSKNARTLSTEISKLVQESTSLVASGQASPDEAYEHTSQVLRQLLQNFGIMGQSADSVIEKYFPRDAFQNALKQTDPKGALEQIFADDPAELESKLKLLTTTQDILGQIVGADGQLHVPTVLDVDKSQLPTNTPPPAPPAPPPPTAPSPNGRGPSGIPLPPQGSHPKQGASPFVGPVAPGDPNFYQMPDGKVYRKSDIQEPLTNPNPIPGAPTPLPNNTIQPTDLGGLLGAPGSNYELSDAQRKSFLDLANNKDALNKAFAENPDIANALQGLVDQANAQGQNMGVAFAQGLLTSNDQVKDALLKLAQLAPDILGNSPARYGPLSGRGWTLYRGQKFTSDYAKGIVSQADSVKSAGETIAGGAADGLGSGPSGPALTMDDSLTRTIKDIQELSDFGKKILDFGKQIADIGFGAAKFANDLSGGRLFPKSYVKDPNFDARRGSPIAPWNPQGWNPTNRSGAQQNSGGTGQQLPTGRVDPNAKGDAAASAFIAQAQARGWNQEQILAGLGVFNQETGYATNPRTNDVQNQNGTAGITGGFQQDMSYRKYGDPRDVNNAINGFLTEFENRGQGLNDPNPWRHAVSDVQIPADAGAGGYNDSDGSYLRNRQRQQALDTFNRLAGGASNDLYSAANTNPALTDAVSSVVSSVDDALLSRIPKGEYVTPDEGKDFDLSKGLADCSSAIEDLYNEMKGIPTSGRSLSTGNAADWLTERGFLPTESVVQGAFNVAFNSGHMQATLPGGTNFNWGSDSAAQQGGRTSQGAYDPSLTQRFYLPVGADGSLGQPGGSTGLPVTLTGPDRGQLSQIAGATSTLGTMPAKLQELVAGDPLLQGALTNQAALTQDSVVPVLQHMDGLIADYSKTNTPENKAMASSLSDMKQNLQNRFGLQEGPTGLDQAQTMVNGVSGIASDAFALFDQGLKTIAATQDIADTLVRGVANTKDVNRLIDDAQEFVTLFQKGFQLASSVTGFASQIAGASGGMDMGAGGALGAASALTGMISQALAAVNTAIDIGQQAYQITMKYVGRFLTNWLGLPGATDANFLLDTMTGQLKAYTSENPENKSTMNVFGREAGLESGRYTERQAPTNILTIYQGPGQDPRDTMNDAMFAVRASGVGAFGYAD